MCFLKMINLNVVAMFTIIFFEFLQSDKNHNSKMIPLLYILEKKVLRINIQT